MNFPFLWRFAKVFSAKIYFQAIRYRTSGRGALGYVLVGVVHWVTANSRKFSPRKSIIKQFAKVFSRERNINIYIYLKTCTFSYTYFHVG